MEDQVPLLSTHPTNDNSHGFGFFCQNSRCPSPKRPLIKKTVGTLLIGVGVSLIVLASAYPKICHFSPEQAGMVITTGVCTILFGLLVLWLADRGISHLNRQGNAINIGVNVGDGKNSDPSSVTTHRLSQECIGSTTASTPPVGLGLTGSVTPNNTESMLKQSR